MRVPHSVKWNALDERADSLDTAVQEDDGGYRDEGVYEAAADEEDSIVEVENRAFHAEGGGIVSYFCCEECL